MDNQKIANLLETTVRGQIRIDEPMSCHTSFHIGGPADVLVIPEDVEDIRALLKTARDNNIPLTVLGNGSNVLVRDKGIRGIVMKMGNALKYRKKDGRAFSFGSGISLAQCCRIIAEEGLTGMEFASGIPGSLGGAVYMNAGAYDGEMKNIVRSVLVMNRFGQIKTLQNEDLDFSYRHSALQGADYIVIEVCIQAETGNKKEIFEKMEDFNRRRISKQPLELPSAGSTFKRPEGHFAGYLIEQCGLKGFRIGGAEVSPKHAGFIVNAGQATAADVLQLIEHVQTSVRNEYGVKLEPEILVLGEK